MFFGREGRGRGFFWGVRAEGVSGHLDGASACGFAVVVVVGGGSGVL